MKLEINTINHDDFETYFPAANPVVVELPEQVADVILQIIRQRARPEQPWLSMVAVIVP